MIENLPPINHDIVYSWRYLQQYVPFANLVLINGKSIKDRWFQEDLPYTSLKWDTQCTAKWYGSDIRLLKVDLLPKEKSPKGIKIEISYL